MLLPHKYFISSGCIREAIEKEFLEGEVHDPEQLELIFLKRSLKHALFNNDGPGGCSNGRNNLLNIDFNTDLKGG